MNISTFKSADSIQEQIEEDAVGLVCDLVSGDFLPGYVHQIRMSFEYYAIFAKRLLSVSSVPDVPPDPISYKIRYKFSLAVYAEITPDTRLKGAQYYWDIDINGLERAALRAKILTGTDTE